MILLEEALLQGIPTLVIDPKGDMGNLLLTFPDSRPERLPAVDQRGRGRSATASPPDELAARRAEMWENGLAGSGIGKDRIARLRGRGRLHDLHARVHRRRPAQRHRSTCEPPAADADPESAARRDRRPRSGAARPRGHRRRSALGPRTHPARQPHQHRLDRRAATSTSAAPARPDPEPADAQARRDRARHLLPGDGPHRSSP